MTSTLTGAARCSLRYATLPTVTTETTSTSSSRWVMAKEGSDWIWCEHALAVGYRNSLTENVQIIGRVTRDAPGKAHVKFTNLVAEPSAAQSEVVEAVNGTIKAIIASLLMEQVIAPTLRLHGEERRRKAGL